MKFLGKRVLVYGMGLSGQACCKLLHEKGALVSFYDDENRFASLFSFDKSPQPENYDILVVSPGIKVIGNALIGRFISAGKKILSEIDLAYLFVKGKIIAVTGTNGKTTTTSLIGHIFKESGKKCFVCGNIGLPITSVCSQTDNESTLICEISNFQLELSSLFKSDVACVTNLAPDHIDRHGSFEEYLRVKKKILTQKRNQQVVLNADNEILKSLIINKKTLYFSKKYQKNGVFIKNNAIYYKKTKVISVTDIPLFGVSNLENVMAAVAVCICAKIKIKEIKKAIYSFSPPAHRLEYIGQIGGAYVFDDSKATNISAVENAVISLNANNLTLLMGGQDKDFNFDEFFANNFNISTLICFGEAGEKIAKSAVKFGYQPQVFQSMKDGVRFARAAACEGGTILLSPACASFDEFASYAVRGQVFKELMYGQEN